VAITEDRETTYVRNGEAYRRSLQDGRQVFYAGEPIDDVTAHPATAGGIEVIADLYEDQLRPETQNVLTYTREDGARVTASYFLPRTKDHLRWRRQGIEHVARRTYGMFGRGIDMISQTLIGFVSEHPSFKRECPEFADNIFWYRTFAEENNLHLAATIVDPQGYRARPTGTADTEVPPERATARIVKENSKGIWISGVKGVGTAAAQANEVIVGNLHAPLDPEAFWLALPLNSPGIRMYSRELAHVIDSPWYHPIDRRGEELEVIIAFDEVFVPRERIFSANTRRLHGVNFYDQVAQHEHWYTFIRHMAKAELHAGLAQLVVDTLDLGEVPIVRQRVAQVFRYAAALRAFALAAEELATVSEGEVMIPDMATVSAGRAYGLELYPQIQHIIRDICGQGLVFRFTEADLEAPAAFGKNLAWFLETRSASAQDKNRIMGLVWDLTAGSHAARVELFEESNALNVPFLLERVYNEYNRKPFIDECRYLLGLGPAPERSYVHEIKQTWSEKKERGRY
jgi:4-hydroxyphenylacetate 3-monooxygenase